MKILVVTTGGTIGSRYDGHSIVVNDDRSLPVIDEYKKISGDSVSFETLSPVNMLSENISTDDLRIIYRTLCEIDYDSYEGVILTCGSDTISYIGAFIGLFFEGRNIVIVATNRMLSLKGSNGFDNFTKAVELIKNEPSKRVRIPWKNSDGIMRVYDATNILPCDINGDIYSFGEIQSIIKKDLPEFSGVLMIDPYPFMDYGLYNTDDIDCVLHLTYHSATADSARIGEFVRLCENKGKKVYFTGVKKDQKIYSSTKELMDLGMIPLYDMAYPCAYIRLLTGLY